MRDVERVDARNEEVFMSEDGRRVERKHRFMLEKVEDDLPGSAGVTTRPSDPQCEQASVPDPRWETWHRNLFIFALRGTRTCPRSSQESRSHRKVSTDPPPSHPSLTPDLSNC